MIRTFSMIVVSVLLVACSNKGFYVSTDISRIANTNFAEYVHPMNRGMGDPNISEWGYAVER